MGDKRHVHISTVFICENNSWPFVFSHRVFHMICLPTFVVIVIHHIHSFMDYFHSPVDVRTHSRTCVHTIAYTRTLLHVPACATCTHIDGKHSCCSLRVFQQYCSQLRFLYCMVRMNSYSLLYRYLFLWVMLTGNGVKRSPCIRNGMTILRKATPMS